MAKKKLKLDLEFMPNDNNFDEVMSNALMAQLMVTITQIGIRVDNYNDDAIIEKEKEYDKEN